MYEDEDERFFDELYQLYSLTSKAKTGYWMPEEDESFPGCFNIIAVDMADESRKPVAAFLSSEDAEFIAGLQGAIPDLIRRLHEAIDEAVRKDEANDIAQGHLADTLLENHGLREQIRELERKLDK